MARAKEIARAEKVNGAGVKIINTLCEEVYYGTKEYAWYQTHDCSDGKNLTTQFCRYKRFKKMQEEMDRYNFYFTKKEA